MLEVKHAINSSLSSILDFGPIRKIFSNPIYAAIITVCFILLIIHIVSENEDDVKYAKLFVWLSVLCTGVMLIHEKVINDDFSSTNKIGGGIADIYNDVDISNETKFVPIDTITPESENFNIFGL